MAYIYRSELIAPEAVPAYEAANAVGSTIILPDIAGDPEKKVTYTVEKIEVRDAPPHPETKEPVKAVTLMLKPLES